MDSLPPLDPLAREDERLRQVAADREAVERALLEAEAKLDTASADERARILGYIGNALRLLGRHAEAVAAQRASLAAAHGRQALVARVRLGEALRCADDPAAERELQAAVAEARAGWPDLLDFALQHLGKTLLDAGRRTEAATALAEALALREAKGDAELVESTRRALERARP